MGLCSSFIVPRAVLAGALDAAAVAAAMPRRGLDERSDTRHSLDAPPVVYHPLYSAPQLPPGHRFPMVGVAV